MKKLFEATRIIVTIGLLAQVQTGLAQNVAGVNLSGEPVPVTTTTTTNGTTGGGANTTGTTTTGTNTTTGTGTRTTTGTTRTSTGTNTTGTTSQTSTVPAATDIPVVPTLTQQTTDNSQPSTLVCDQDKCAATVQKVMGNEVIVMTILFLGSGIGGIIWILALMMMKKGVVERESRRMERQNRMQLQSMMTSQKTSAYNSYINAVMTLIDRIQHKKTPAASEMQNFTEGSIFINMHGSKHLRAMNDHIASLIDAGKPLAPADRTHLKSELSKTIRADLI